MGLPWAYHSCIDRCSTICAAPLTSDTLEKLCGRTVHGATHIQVIGLRLEPHPTGASEAKATVTDSQLHWCPLRLLLGGFTLISFVVQKSALVATKYIPESGPIRVSHPILACCTRMLQSVPPMTLEPQLATNRKTRSSMEPLLGRRLAAFYATATHQSGWSILEAAVQDDPDAAAFVSFAFSFRLYQQPTLEQLHAG